MQSEFSAEQQQQLLTKLTIPFHPDAISWRATNKSKTASEAVSFHTATSAPTRTGSTKSSPLPAGRVSIT